MKTWAVTVTNTVLGTLLQSSTYETEEVARGYYTALVAVSGRNPVPDTRINLIEINGRVRTLLASVDIRNPEESR